MNNNMLHVNGKMLCIYNDNCVDKNTTPDLFTLSMTMTSDNFNKSDILNNSGICSTSVKTSSTADNYDFYIKDASLQNIINGNAEKKSYMIVTVPAVAAAAASNISDSGN